MITTSVLGTPQCRPGTLVPGVVSQTYHRHRSRIHWNASPRTVDTPITMTSVLGTPLTRPGAIEPGALPEALTFSGAEILNFDDFISPSHVTYRTLTDILTFNTTFSVRSVYSVQMVDNLAWSEVMVSRDFHNPTMVDSLGWAESYHATLRPVLGVADAIPWMETLQRDLQVRRTMAETLTFSENYNQDKVIERSMTDHLFFGSTLRRQYSHHPPVHDTLTFAEILTPHRIISRNFQEILNFSEIRVSKHLIFRNYEDTLILGEHVSRTGNYLRSLGDVLNLAEQERDQRSQGILDITIPERLPDLARFRDSNIQLWHAGKTIILPEPLWVDDHADVEDAIVRTLTVLGIEVTKGPRIRCRLRFAFSPQDIDAPALDRYLTMVKNKTVILFAWVYGVYGGYASADTNALVFDGIKII